MGYTASIANSVYLVNTSTIEALDVARDDGAGEVERFMA